MASALVALALGVWAIAVMRPLGVRARRSRTGSPGETLVYQTTGLLVLFTSAVLVIVVADIVAPRASVGAHYPGVLTMYGQLLLWVVASLRTRHNSADGGPISATGRLLLTALVLLGLAAVSALAIVVWSRTAELQAVLTAMLGVWAVVSVPLLVTVVAAAALPGQVSSIEREIRRWGALGDIVLAWVSWILPVRQTSGHRTADDAQA